MNFKTYGKTPLYKKAVLQIKNRFKTNPHTETIFNKKGLFCYIPKLNKLRFYVGCVGFLVCVVVPFITPLSILPLLWGLK